MSRLAIDRQEQIDERRSQIFLGMAAILYPLFGLLFNQLENLGGEAEMQGRLTIGGLQALFFFGTLFSAWIRRKAYVLMAISSYLMTAHYFCLIAQHQSNEIYILGTFITTFACASIFEGRYQLLTYFVFVLTLAFGIPSIEQDIPKTVFVFGLATALIIFYYGAYTRFQAMDDMRENTQRIVEIFEIMTDGFLLIDRNWNLLSVNGEAQRILKCEGQNLIGVPFWHRFSEFQDPLLRQKLEIAMNRGLKASFQAYVSSLDAHLDFRVYPSSLGLSVYIHDISEKRKTEVQLIRKQELLEEAERMANLGHWDFNFATKEATWSDELYRIFGIEKNPENQASLALIQKRTHPDDWLQVTFELERVRATGQSASGTYRLIMADQQVKWVASRISSVKDSSGKPVGLRGIVQDVTEEQTAKFKALNSAKMAALGEMSSGVAHEINNPLAIIHAKAQQLQISIEKGRVNTPEIVSATEKIKSTAMRINRIIKSLRTFARDGENDAFRREFLQNILDDTTELSRERFKNQSVELRTSIPDNLAFECRSVQICQVLLNLLNNAFDATVGQSHRWVEIAARDLGSEIEISVSDSGPGIPPEIRDKVFQPFFTTKDIGKGTGLGLSVSKGIIESHKGTIRIDASLKMSRVLIRLPKAQARSDQNLAAG